MLNAEFVAAFRTGKLTSEQADLFVQRDPLEIRFLLMQLSLAMVAPTVSRSHALRVDSSVCQARHGTAQKSHKNERPSRDIPERVVRFRNVSIAGSSIGCRSVPAVRDSSLGPNARGLASSKTFPKTSIPR